MFLYCQLVCVFLFIILCISTSKQRTLGEAARCACDNAVTK